MFRAIIEYFQIRRDIRRKLKRLDTDGHLFG